MENKIHKKYNEYLIEQIFRWGNSCEDMTVKNFREELRKCKEKYSHLSHPEPEKEGEVREAVRKFLCDVLRPDLLSINQCNKLANAILSQFKVRRKT